MKLLVTGGRDYTNKELLWSTLDEYRERYGDDLIIIHGAHKSGTDKLADEWAIDREVDCLRVPARWKTTTPTKSAGPRRNQRMRDRYKPQEVLATAGGTGTNGMKELAHERGIPVREI
jgi:hypothetical protein